MNDNPFKGFRDLGVDLPKVDIVTPAIQRQLYNTTQQMNSIQREMERVAREKHEKEEQYKQDTLDTLKNIEKNTGDISQLVVLLRANSDKQTEILEVMTEIMSIGSSETNEEAENKYRAVMNKINQTFEDAETMEKLLGYGKMFYHSAKAYIKHRVENG